MIANAKRANASDEYVAVTSIPIADQITRELLPVCTENLTLDAAEWAPSTASLADMGGNPSAEALILGSSRSPTSNKIIQKGLAFFEQTER